jgi:SAM-dependent methyltransferase
MADSISKLLKQKSGIRLDIGCGANKTPTFVGMDYRKLPGVDIVHDIEKTPWPLPDESVLTAVASHVLEHINPHGGIFMNVMDEVWRVLKPGGQFGFVVPYAGSPPYWQDPTHVNGITETTLLYFDPEAEGGNLYGIYNPKPWRIQMCTFDINGFLEVVLVKRPDKKEYHAR